MIKVGGQVGALNTVALIFFTAIIGVYFAKYQGMQTLKSGMINLYQNKMPIYEILSGAALAFAAFLLIVPGFLTDFFGLVLIFPFTRKIIFKNLSKNYKKKTNRDPNKKNFIEGEFEDIDENK